MLQTLTRSTQPDSRTEQSSAVSASSESPDGLQRTARAFTCIALPQPNCLKHLCYSKAHTLEALPVPWLVSARSSLRPQSHEAGWTIETTPSRQSSLQSVRYHSLHESCTEREGADKGTHLQVLGGSGLIYLPPLQLALLLSTLLQAAWIRLHRRLLQVPVLQLWSKQLTRNQHDGAACLSRASAMGPAKPTYPVACMALNDCHLSTKGVNMGHEAHHPFACLLACICLSSCKCRLATPFNTLSHLRHSMLHFGAQQGTKGSGGGPPGRGGGQSCILSN